jgi:protein-S-isoprenylcysteine O-methyltransferase Ste14
LERYCSSAARTTAQAPGDIRETIWSNFYLSAYGGEWRGVLAVLTAFLALWRKLRLEERWMREQFGEAYDAYARRVAALVPYLI